MGWMRIAGFGLIAGFVGLAAIVGLRTALVKPPTSPAAPSSPSTSPVAINNARAAQHLGQAVQFQTVSHQDPKDDQLGEWEKLHQWLETTYPAAHKAMTRTIVAERTLVYEWRGSDAKLPPIILLAHQDVVPVDPGAEKEWLHAPFAGEVVDGAVWGRGSIDDKGSLVMIFEAVEALATRDFQPKRTVFVISCQDEEVGHRGAQAAASYLATRGVKAEFTLDEGSVVLSDFPLSVGPVAMIGLAEKGYATLEVTAPAVGGHSSMPPKETAVITLAKALIAISNNPAPLRIVPPVTLLLDSVTPSAPLALRAALANRWLLEPLLIAGIGATPSGAAMLHTTIAPTMLEGSPKENVLPQAAKGWINYRIAPGDTFAAALARAKAAVGQQTIQLKWLDEPQNPSPVSSTTSPGWAQLEPVVAETTHAPVAPALVIAATDSRYLQGVSNDVYRFQPIVLSLKDTELIHGANEHLTLANVALLTSFYAQLISKAAS